MNKSTFHGSDALTGETIMAQTAISAAERLAFNNLTGVSLSDEQEIAKLDTKEKMAAVLKAFIHLKTLSLQDLQLFSERPLIDTDSYRHTQEFKTFIAERGDFTRDSAKVKVDLDAFPVLEGTFFNCGIGLFSYKILKYSADGKVTLQYYLLGPEVKEDATVAGTKALMAFQGIMETTNDDLGVALWSCRRLSDYGKLTDVSNNEVQSQRCYILAAMWMEIIDTFFSFTESLDRYPVMVRPKAPKAVKVGVGPTPVSRANSVVKNASKIIYLNALPKPQGESAAATGTSQVVHQRRGFWKTLTDPRYKNHPKFGVKKGVRVKPYWAGTRECEYEGNVYKVLTKEDFKDGNISNEDKHN